MDSQLMKIVIILVAKEGCHGIKDWLLSKVCYCKADCQGRLSWGVLLRKIVMGSVVKDVCCDKQQSAGTSIFTTCGATTYHRKTPGQCHVKYGSILDRISRASKVQ